MQVPRVLLAWVAGLALALGTLPQHGGAAEHATGGLKGTFVSEAAGHPRQAEHMETSQIRFHPACAACLLGLQTVGAASPLPARLPVPALGIAFPVPISSLSPSPAHPGGSPRAPPASPVAV
jgi:hypothetical protein